MNVLRVFLFNLISVAGLVAADIGVLPINQNLTRQPVINNTFTCNTIVSGLSSSDCNYLSIIGFTGPGANPSSGSIFVGSGGSNEFSFTNDASSDIVVTIWDDGSDPMTSQASYMNKNPPIISYSLAAGANVTISVADGVSGAWAGVYIGSTGLSPYGQIDQTWGEFTTGPYATVDVSREINSAGNSLSVYTSNGCTTDMNTCVYECKSGTTCYLCGSYEVTNAGGSGCSIDIQTCPDGETYPDGGCKGWSDGMLTISFS